MFAEQRKRNIFRQKNKKERESNIKEKYDD